MTTPAPARISAARVRLLRSAKRIETCLRDLTEEQCLALERSGALDALETSLIALRAGQRIVAAGQDALSTFRTFLDALGKGR